MKLVTLIPGDGIGTEIVNSVKQIFAAVNAPIQWEEINAGETQFNLTGALIPDALIKSIKKNKVALKGPLTTPIGKGFRSVNVSLRVMFDLYTNLRPAKTVPGVDTRYKDTPIDIVLFRENTEGLYAGLEFFDERLQIADSIQRITRKGSERIARAAFDFARKNGRKKVTIFHKANILKISEGLFLEECKNVAKKYPEIICDNMIIDNAFMQLVIRPEQFDCIVSTNMFGDLLSDLLAGLIGGLGVMPGANIGKDVAIFEAVHGTAPDIAGKDMANPTSLLMSAIMMLEYLDMNAEATRIRTALMKTLTDKSKCTGDLGGKCGTQAFTNNVIAELKK